MGQCHQHVVSVYPVGNSWACSHLVLITAPWGRGLSLHPICEESRAGAAGPLAQGHTQGGKEAGFAWGVQGPPALLSALGEGSWASGRLGSRSSRPGLWLRAQAPVDTLGCHVFLPVTMASSPHPAPRGAISPSLTTDCWCPNHAAVASSPFSRAPSPPGRSITLTPTLAPDHSCPSNLI